AVWSCRRARPPYAPRGPAPPPSERARAAPGPPGAAPRHYENLRGAGGRGQRADLHASLLGAEDRGMKSAERFRGHALGNDWSELPSEGRQRGRRHAGSDETVHEGATPHLTIRAHGQRTEAREILRRRDDGGWGRHLVETGKGRRAAHGLAIHLRGGRAPRQHLAAGRGPPPPPARRPRGGPRPP